MRSMLTIVALAGTILAASAITPASALTMKECSTKYQAAKTAGSLNGEKWSDFRKTECGATASTARASAPAPMAPAPVPTTTARTRTSPPVPAGSLAYPSAVDPKYASEKAGKARMHTCLDSYKAAKASASLGGMKWIQKGGGYYSVCNAQLKGV